MMLHISPYLAFFMCPHTNCFQKLLIILLTLKLIFPTERHDAERAEMKKKGKEFMSAERGGSLFLNYWQAYLFISAYTYLIMCHPPHVVFFQDKCQIVLRCKVCPRSCHHQVFPDLT